MGHAFWITLAFIFAALSIVPVVDTYSTTINITQHPNTIFILFAILSITMGIISDYADKKIS